MTDSADSENSTEQNQHLMHLVAGIARECKRAQDRAMTDEDADIAIPPDHLASTLALRLLSMIPRDLGGMK